MATEQNITASRPVIPAAWLSIFNPDGDCRDVHLADVLSRYLRQVSAIANAIEDLEDASDCSRGLGEVLRYKTDDLRAWFDRWDAARAAEHERLRAVNGGDEVDRLAARLNGEPTNASALEALGNEVCSLVQERLTPDEAQWIALAFRTAAEGEVDKAARVLRNVRKNVRRANGTDGPARQGDDGDCPFLVRLESGTAGEDVAGFLRAAAKVIGVLTEYCHDVALDPSLHAGTLGEPVFRDSSSAINQLLSLADRLARAKKHAEVAA